MSKFVNSILELNSLNSKKSSFSHTNFSSLNKNFCLNSRVEQKFLFNSRIESSWVVWHVRNSTLRSRYKRMSVWKFNITTILAIQTRVNKDDYVWWDYEYENDVHYSSNWFSLRQKTKTRTKTRIKKTKRTKTTKTRINNIEINLM